MGMWKGCGRGREMRRKILTVYTHMEATFVQGGQRPRAGGIAELS